MILSYICDDQYLWVRSWYNFSVCSPSASLSWTCESQAPKFSPMAPQTYSGGFIPPWAPAGLCHPKLYLHLYTSSDGVIPRLKCKFDFWSCWRILGVWIVKYLWNSDDLKTTCGIKIEANRGKNMTAEMVYNINCELSLLPGTGWVRLLSPTKIACGEIL